jgi:hypothetical protein
MGLLDGGVKAAVHGGLKAILLPMTLVLRQTTAAENAWEAPTVTEDEHSVRGMISDYEDSEIDGTIVQKGDRKALILAGSYVGEEPLPGDSLTYGSDSYHVLDVKSDPAGATYVLQLRKNV